MFVSLKAVLVPFVSLFILMFANMYFISFIAVYLDQMALGAQTLSQLSTIYFLGYVIGALVIERVIDRLGLLWSFSVFSCLKALIAIAMIFTPHIWIWLPMRFAQGVCMAGIYIVMETWFLLRVGEKKLGSGFSIYMLGLFTAQGLSYQILEWFDPLSSAPFLVYASLCLVSALPLWMSSQKVPEPKHNYFLNIRKAFEFAPLGVLSCFVSGTILAQIYMAMPYYYLSIGYSTDDMGKLMGAVFCGAVLAQGPAGWLSDRFDRAKLLITMMTVSLLISLCSLLFSPMLPFFYVGIGAFIFGAAIFSIYPLGISHSCDELYNKDLIGTLSVLLSVNSFGCLVSASFSGFFMTYFPVHGFYLYSTSLLAFLLVYLSYKLQKPLAQPA